MTEVLKDFTTVLLAIIGVAILAVFVSKKSNTAGVINAGGNAFSNALATAEGPVTGYTPGTQSTGSAFGIPAFGSSGSLAGLQIPELGAGFNSYGGA